MTEDDMGRPRVLKYRKVLYINTWLIKAALDPKKGPRQQKYPSGAT